MKPIYFVIFAVLTLACNVSTVTPTPAPASLPSATAAVNTSPARRLEQYTPAGRVVIVNAAVLTVRSESSTNAEELGYVYENAELVTTGKYRGGEGDCTHWTQIAWNDGAGWVCSAFIYPK